MKLNNRTVEDIRGRFGDRRNVSGIREDEPRLHESPNMLKLVLASATSGIKVPDVGNSMSFPGGKWPSCKSYFWTGLSELSMDLSSTANTTTFSQHGSVAIRGIWTSVLESRTKGSRESNRGSVNQPLQVLVSHFYGPIMERCVRMMIFPIAVS